MLSPFQNAFVLTGPTGSGKSALGVELAGRLGAEIISMDSMALYRGLDIGTAKPTAAQRQAVPHHLIDVVEPWESASVAWWLEQAGRACAEIEARGKRALFVGGTPLYLKALMFGLFEGPPADPELRARLGAEARELGSAALHARLMDIDPATAARLHPNDERRIIRALEVHATTGRPISAWQTQWRASADNESGSDKTVGATPAENPSSGSDLLPASGSRVVWLDLPRAELYERINRRVEAMFAAGLVEEVAGLCRLGRPLSREAGQALGYKEVLAHLAGERDLPATIELVQTRTRNFAKRQVTWFRHLRGCVPVTTQLTAALWQPTIR